MTELEIVLLIAFAIMTLMYWRAERKRLFMSCALVAVGLKEAYICNVTRVIRLAQKHNEKSRLLLPSVETLRFKPRARA